MSSPKIVKLYAILNKNKYLLDSPEMEPIPYGDGNPYSYCASCHRSMIEVSYSGHFKNCEYEKLENKIKSIEGLINIELDKFLKNEEYNSVSFKHFIWFKQDKYVEGLSELNEKIKKHLENKT